MKFLDNLSRPAVLVLCFGLVAGVWIVDYLTGDELAFSIFYLAPVVIVTWADSRRLGLLFSALCAAGWYSADFLSGHVYFHPLVPAWNALVRLSLFFIVVISLSKLKDAHLKEKELARRDQLTGLNNMHSFSELAGAQISRLSQAGEKFSLIFIDLDDFKEMNDRFGHGAGNALLAEVAEFIARHTRKSDVAARFGGDEFVIFLSEAALEDARKIAARMKAEIEDHIRARNYPVTLSVGISSFTGAPPSLDDLIKHSDRLMYEVKAEGKNNLKARAIN